jgi:hypothetical protein
MLDSDQVAIFPVMGVPDDGVCLMMMGHIYLMHDGCLMSIQNIYQTSHDSGGDGRHSILEYRIHSYCSDAVVFASGLFFARTPK